ncbi:MAG: DUF3298 domain-containing protein [Clostridia bacterium]|nr:DUF3298 domain-containing protein [Clostridia bacterium]
MTTPSDRDIRRQLEAEGRPAVPDFVHQMTEATLAALPEKLPVQRRPSPFKRISAAAACAALLMLGVLPNVSPAYAQAAGRIPLLGSLIRVLTIRNYTYDDGRHLLEADIPHVEDDDNAEAAALINADIDALTNAAVSRFYHELELSGQGYGSIHIDYETVTATDRWFTLQLRVTETAASSTTYLKYYHIDRQTGRHVGFGDLFAPDSFAALEAAIRAEMQAQMDADPQIDYYIEDEQPDGALTTLSADQPFFFTENGDLVIVYDKYTIAPGSMGNPAFTIPKSVYEPLLK